MKSDLVRGDGFSSIINIILFTLIFPKIRTHRSQHITFGDL